MNFLRKIEYKLWKHLNKKMFCKQKSNMWDRKIDQLSNKIDQLNNKIDCIKKENEKNRNEFLNFRTYSIMKDVCPDLNKNIIHLFDYPNGEKGSLYKDFFLDKYSYIRDWHNDAYFKLNAVSDFYQSSIVDFDSFLEKNKYLYNQPSSFFLSCYQILRKKLYVSSYEEGKEFVDKWINYSDFVKQCNPDTVLRIVVWFLYYKEYERAESLLDEYMQINKFYLIDRWLPISSFLYDKGYQQFKLQNDVFKNIEKYSLNSFFEDYVKNKKIALIGNGPQEKGKHLGNKIDSYDLVVRMNDFELSPEYIEDYGKKTDIWYRIILEKEKKYPFQMPKISFLGTSPYWFQYSVDLLEKYEKEMSMGQNFRIMTIEEYFNICRDLHLMHPSGGAIMVYLLRKYNKNFSIDDCYGFSFKQKESEPIEWKHYDGKELNLPVHNLEVEKDVLNTFLQSK